MQFVWECTHCGKSISRDVEVTLVATGDSDGVASLQVFCSWDCVKREHGVNAAMSGVSNQAFKPGSLVDLTW